MTTDQLSFREAFEAWMKGREGYPFARQFADLMWKAWQGAMESRPTAVASHAEGEVVAWQWRLAGSDGLWTEAHSSVIDAMRSLPSHYETRPLYLHPPRSGDEAMVRVANVIRQMRNCATDIGNARSLTGPWVADTLNWFADEMGIDAAMAASGGSSE